MGSPPVAPRRRPASPLRITLLLAVVAALAILALVIALDPRRIGVFADQSGRSAAPGEPGWAYAAPAPIALTEVAAAAHRGRIWVAGGLDAAGHAVDLVQVYDPVGNHWAEGTALPEPVHHAALVSDGDALFLIGGYTGDGFDRPTAAVWRLDDTDGGPWTADQPLPEPRGAGAAAWNGQGLIMYGGGVGPAGVSDGVFVREDDGLAPAGDIEPTARASRCKLGRRRIRHVPGWPRSDGQPRDGRSRVGGGHRRPDRGPAHAAWRYRRLLGRRARRLRRRWRGSERDVRGGRVRRRIRNHDLPGLEVPRHGLGAVFVEGRAYVLLGGRQPGLTVSDVVEVLDLR